MRIVCFLQEAPADSCFKEIEKKYIAFNSPQINTVSNIDGTKFLVLLMWAEEWCWPEGLCDHNTYTEATVLWGVNDCGSFLDILD